MLSGGRISTHIAAGHSFAGQKVELQQFIAGAGWQTIDQLPLGAAARASSSRLARERQSARLRIAMSVNQAGSGFLGTTSDELADRA